MLPETTFELQRDKITKTSTNMFFYPLIGILVEELKSRFNGEALASLSQVKNINVWMDDVRAEPFITTVYPEPLRYKHKELGANRS